MLGICLLPFEVSVKICSNLAMLYTLEELLFAHAR